MEKEFALTWDCKNAQEAQRSNNRILHILAFPTRMNFWLALGFQGRYKAGTFVPFINTETNILHLDLVASENECTDT